MLAVPDAVDRERLRCTFDRAAERYHRARPEYPEQLFDDLVRLAELPPHGRLLEIGCGTGKATAPLARRGFHVTCIELGENLASAAASNLARFPDVQIVNASYDVWQPPHRETFDLVFAATSWHWLDPVTRYKRAWELLRPDGFLAFWGATQVFPNDGDPFFRAIQPVYNEIGEGLPPHEMMWPRPGELPEEREEVANGGLFHDVQVRQYDWEVRYDAESYIDLLETFSGHIAMALWQRERLHEAIHSRLSERPDRQLRRHWGAALHIARRSEPS